MRVLLGFVLGLIAVAVAGLIYIFSGSYNVAATVPHGWLDGWVLNTVMETSVHSHARGITAPPLSDAALIDRGFRQFNENCVMCHGAPGVDYSDVGKGLTPEPPVLSDAVKDWSPAELFWIVKNGIKMTGMPAWGASRSDQDLWAIVAFLERLPTLSPDQYRAMAAAAGAAPGTGRP